MPLANFQHSTRLVAPIWPCFAIRLLNKLPMGMTVSKNKPRHPLELCQIRNFAEFHPLPIIFAAHSSLKT